MKENEKYSLAEKFKKELFYKCTELFGPLSIGLGILGCVVMIQYFLS